MNYLDLDLELTEDDISVKSAAHRFAKEVMRPIAKKLDEMTPEAVIAKNSPFWEFMRKAYELGYHSVLIPESYGGMDLTPKQQAIIYEELAWGSVGLAVALGIAGFPSFAASLAGTEILTEKIIKPFCACRDGSVIGCFAITEPDHGTDTLVPFYPTFRDPSIPAQCRATLDGDEYVISGQKSAWVSMGTISTTAALFCQTDPSMGHAGGAIFAMPLDLPGISKGPALNKLGQRDLNQGEIFFDDVRVPKDYLIAEAEAYEALVEISLSASTVLMGVFSAGIARAAFDEALEYAKQRVQGGKRLVDYPNVQQKLFHMFSKVETTRLISRAAWIYNQNTSMPAEEYSNIAKVYGTQAAFEVCNDAIQIFGANGLTKEYLIEKLFRDSRAMLIEDGSNDSIAIAGGHKLIETYPRLNQ